MLSRQARQLPSEDATYWIDLMGHLCDGLAIQSLGLMQHVYRADPLTEVFAVGRASGGPIATAAPHLAKMSDAVIYDFSLAA